MKGQGREWLNHSLEHSPTDASLKSAQVQAAVEEAVETFGGIDILVNNASAIDLAQTPDVSMRRYDLMHNVNARGTFLCTKICLPHLSRAHNPHVLMLSPPLNMKSEWFAKQLLPRLTGESACQ